MIDSEYFLNRCLDEGKSVLAEGAQGTMLDVDFGSYPFVTSSNTISAGVCSGLGIAPNRIGIVYGVFKAYCTRVGSGPFPTELFDETGETLRRGGHEFGSTTGRPRRCGWIDLPALKYAIMLNGVDALIMMKVDVLSSVGTIHVCTRYEVDGVETETLPFDLCGENIIPVYTELKGWKADLGKATTYEQLPLEVKEYVGYIEKSAGLPVSMVSVGPDRTQTILRETL
jgi:adenylosuccinate synthase